MSDDAQLIRDALDYGGDYMPMQNCRVAALDALDRLLVGRDRLTAELATANDNEIRLGRLGEAAQAGRDSLTEQLADAVSQMNAVLKATHQSVWDESPLHKALAAAEAARDEAIVRLGAIILALRHCPDGFISSSLRAGIMVAESDFFNTPTEEGRERRGFLDTLEAAVARAERAEAALGRAAYVTRNLLNLVADDDLGDTIGPEGQHEGAYRAARLIDEINDWEAIARAVLAGGDEPALSEPVDAGTGRDSAESYASGTKPVTIDGSLSAGESGSREATPEQDSGGDRLGAFSRAEDDQPCVCGHTTYWHSRGGKGDCEYGPSCVCEAFVVPTLAGRLLCKLGFHKRERYEAFPISYGSSDCQRGCGA